MKKYSKQFLVGAGIICFFLALFQAAIGFSPSLSSYFGAPEALANNRIALIAASLLIAGILAMFGVYAVSGAGKMGRMPWLKQVLVAISIIFILRGLLIIPELLVFLGILQSSIPVPVRFIFLSLGTLLISFLLVAGTIGQWKSLSSHESAGLRKKVTGS